MKVLKIIVLVITLPLSFFIIGIIGTFAFFNLFINDEKRNKLIRL